MNSLASSRKSHAVMSGILYTYFQPSRPLGQYMIQITDLISGNCGW